MIISRATTIADAVRLAVATPGCGDYWRSMLVDGPLQDATYRNQNAGDHARQEAHVMARQHDFWKAGIRSAT